MTTNQIDLRRRYPASAAPTSRRLLAAPTPDAGTHRHIFGPLPTGGADQLLEQVRRSGLTGRGGAGFPTAVKLRAVAEAAGTAVVVANGAEGEPASGKDRQLLLGAPHLVLDGLQIAARLTGADQAFAYLRADAVPAVRRALAERAAAGEDRIPVTVVEAADSFVSGQETAVVSRLNGGPARPQFARVRVTERGVYGRPTLVQNVETLGHLALIARYGGAWFREIGAPDAPGTFLATVHRTGVGEGSGSVQEVPHGTPVGALLAATGALDQVQAVLIGGYHGRWLPLPAALDAPLSAAGLAPVGGSLGAGVVIPLSSADCGLEATAQIVSYLAAQSAQQCGPCQFGLPHLAERVVALAAAGRTGGGSAGLAAVAAIREAVGLVEGRGACHHPDGTAGLVRSALDTFEPDVVLHGHGQCSARNHSARNDSARNDSARNHGGIR